MSDLIVKDLTVEFERATYVVRALENLSFEAETGELVLLLGPSGCGKTTLLSCLAGILRPTSGSIRVDDTEVTELRGQALDRYRQRTVGIVFQAFNLIPSLTALENVEAPLWLAGMHRGTARERARDLLEIVGLEERMRHRPAGLSGGQQQRVAIARGLAHDPPIVLADEPTAHLDYVQVEGLLRILRMVAKPGRLVVISTHDERLVPISDRVVELAPKTIAHSVPPQHLTFEPGDVIFGQGTRGTLIYVVDDGVVEIVRERDDRTQEVVAAAGAGEYFGELGPLLGFPRTATARARTAVKATAYSVQDFRARAHSDPKIAAILGRADRTAPPVTGNGDKPKRRGTVDGRRKPPPTTGGGRRPAASRTRAP